MKKLALVVGILAFPLISFAAAGDISGLESLVDDIANIVEKLIPIVFALGLLVFFWGLVKYIFGAEHEKENAKKTMIWGVVALFIMASIWGLVKFIGDAFGVNSNVGAPQVGIPQVTGQIP